MINPKVCVSGDGFSEVERTKIRVLFKFVGYVFCMYVYDHQTLLRH